MISCIPTLIDYQAPDLIYQHGGEPGEEGGVENGESSPFPFAWFILDADAGGDAREVEEDEEHEGEGDEWCHATGGDVAMIEHCHGACHNLFGSDTCNEGDSLKGRDCSLPFMFYTASSLGSIFIPGCKGSVSRFSAFLME